MSRFVSLRHAWDANLTAADHSAMHSVGPWSGHCGQTDYMQKDRMQHACTIGGQKKAAWAADAISVRSVSACAEHCRQHCPRCVFVSFSAKSNDCSWYRSCSRLQHSFGGSDFQTLQVRDLPPEVAASLAPPPPPAHEVPRRAAPGYCALMGPELGSCTHSSQGSWAGVASPGECVARCEACERCDFVSFTTANATEAATPRADSAAHPPHWWRCRWFSSCDLNDLRASPPAHEPWQYMTLRVDSRLRPSQGTLPLARAAPGLRKAAKVTNGLRVALVALLELSPEGNQQRNVYLTGFVQWCQNAARLEAALPPHWKLSQLLLSSDARLAPMLARRAGCAALQHVPVSTELRTLATSCVDKLQYWKPLFFQAVNLYKWQLLNMDTYDALVFADVDLELVPAAEHDPAWVGAVWRRAITGLMRHPQLNLVADPDVYSPLNGGLMLVKPSPALYRDGLRVLRACRFNASAGWELVGTRPREVTGYSSTFLDKTRAWDFGGAGTEQGFIFYMLWLRHRVGAYGSRDRRILPLSRHWWSGSKPWARCDPKMISAQTEVDWGLLSLYDYVLREAPVLGPLEPAAALAHGRQTGEVPPLVAKQRAVRRAIEAHPRFADIFEQWQATAWGDGFCFTVTLPLPGW